MTIFVYMIGKEALHAANQLPLVTNMIQLANYQHT